jgi:hypothetical protein
VCLLTRKATKCTKSGTKWPRLAVIKCPISYSIKPCVRFEVLTAVRMMFWVLASCRLTGRCQRVYTAPKPRRTSPIKPCFTSSDYAAPGMRLSHEIVRITKYRSRRRDGHVASMRQIQVLSLYRTAKFFNAAKSANFKGYANEIMRTDNGLLTKFIQNFDVKTSKTQITWTTQEMED